MKSTRYHIKMRNIRYQYHPIAMSVFLLLAFLMACEDFVEIDAPKTEIIGETVYTDENTAKSAISGIYSEMIGINSGLASGGTASVTYLTGLSGDDLIYYSFRPDPLEFNMNSLTVGNTSLASGLWTQTYKLIFYANSVIEGLANSTNITDGLKKQLEGEAKFIRAFCHFYLVNLFGDAPLVMTTDFQVNTLASRTPTAQVYTQIIDDLMDAENLLGSDYVTGERVRPNKATAMALLARVYLYAADWSNAEATATEIINNPTYSLEDDLNNVFLANSNEAIWQLSPILPNFNTNEGFFFILASPPDLSSSGTALSDQLLAAFEVGDNRLSNWVNTFTDGTNVWYYPFKYKIRLGSPASEYSMVLRLAEQYLVRAQARAMQNNITGAQSDLDVIRNRAGLPNTIANDQASLLLAIEQERRVEFFTEWGHRWLDLKRTDRINAVMSQVKDNWQPTDVLYPIPQSELENNLKLSQNPGY